MLFTQKIDQKAQKRRERYRIHSKLVRDISIFSKGWWLDATAGEENWDVALITSDGEIIASMPYMIKKKLGFLKLTQPTLTPKLGPWIKKSNLKNVNQLKREKDLMNKLIDQLPRFSDFSQNWHYEYTNWLPFYWRDFTQTTKYSYLLPRNLDTKEIWKGLAESARREIRKAKNRYSLIIRDDLSIKEFLKLNLKTFTSKGLKIPYSESFIYKLDSICEKQKLRKILIAEDSEGRRHAAVYIVWDEKYVYYLMGGADPYLRKSGAFSFCMWEAICFSINSKKSFDFEGSMIEPVERFFRSFGAIQTPYFSITRTPSKLLSGYKFFQSIFQVIKY